MLRVCSRPAPVHKKARPPDSSPTARKTRFQERSEHRPHYRSITAGPCPSAHAPTVQRSPYAWPASAPWPARALAYSVSFSLSLILWLGTRLLGLSRPNPAAPQRASKPLPAPRSRSRRPTPGCSSARRYGAPWRREVAGVPPAAFLSRRESRFLPGKTHTREKSTARILAYVNTRSQNSRSVNARVGPLPPAVQALAGRGPRAGAGASPGVPQVAVFQWHLCHPPQLGGRHAA